MFWPSQLLVWFLKPGALHKHEILRKSGGYDTFVVMQWLLHEMEQHQQLDLPLGLRLALFSANHVISIWSNGGTSLSNTELANCERAGKLFARCYMLLASQSVARKRFRFRMRPKFHLFMRMCVGKNLVHVTWMDEDSLKRLMATLGLTDVRSAEKRLLQRWLMGLPATWKEVRSLKKTALYVCKLCGAIL